MFIRFESSDAAVENGASPDNVTIRGNGPDGFDWVQLTYAGLRVSPNGDHVAYIDYSDSNEHWCILDKPNGKADGRWFSDIVIG